MKTPITGGAPPVRIQRRNRSRRVIRLCGALVLLLTAVGHVAAQTQQTKPVGSEPNPESAISAVLAAFDNYEVVGMSVAHGMKDQDDFILSLIRAPAFPEKVNDIAVECGNSLYQPILDRYIAGEDVPFTEVQKVWRNTTQPMCGMSGFFGQFFHSCAQLIKSCRQQSDSGYWLVILPLTGTRSRASGTLKNLIAMSASLL
jgi:hypothetical protein